MRKKEKGGSSLVDSGLGTCTYSRQSGPTLMTRSQFSDQVRLNYVCVCEFCVKT